MRHSKSIVPTVLLLAALMLSVATSALSASACSLAQVPDWLNFVLSHGLANLNPDCTLTWKTGVVTDLNGNLVASQPYSFLQQYGVILFFVGLVLATIGIYLTVRATRQNAKS